MPYNIRVLSEAYAPPDLAAIFLNRVSVQPSRNSPWVVTSKMDDDVIRNFGLARDCYL